MALTAAQTVDLRRWMGYPVPTGEDLVYSQAWPTSLTLTDMLASLTADQETVLTTVYLAQLTILEAAIPAAADNLDTSVAGPWTANPREMGQRTALFNKWRRDMCDFLGFPYGPSLGDGQMRLIRG